VGGGRHIDLRPTHVPLSLSPSSYARGPEPEGAAANGRGEADGHIWLNAPIMVLRAILMASLGGGFGYGGILITAGLSNIDRHLYEATALDGGIG
jgi:ABC-type sugar transport system permease subunit